MPATQRQPASAEKGQAPAEMPAKLVRLAQYLIAALFILGPLAVTQPGKLIYNSLDTPRRLLLLLGVGLLMALILRAWSLRRRITLRCHLLDIAVVAYFILVVVSSIGGVYPRISFFGALWLQDGLLLLGIGVGLYFGIKEFLRTPEDYLRFVTLLGIVGGVVAAIGLFEWAVIGQPYQAVLKEIADLNRQIANGTLSPGDPHLQMLLEQKAALAAYSLNPNFLGWRLTATLGNPMFTGAYLAMTLPVAAGAALATRRQGDRIILAVSVALMLIALVLTQTRSAWIGFGLSVPFMMGLVLVEWYKRRSVVFAVTAVILLGLIGAAMAMGSAHPQLRARLKSIVNMEDATRQTRLIYMQTALNIFKDRQIQGAGYGNIKSIFPEYRPESMVIESNLPLNRGYSTSQPHNILMQTAAESGFMGLIPFLVLAVLLYRTGFSLLRGTTPQAWLSIGLLGGITAYYVTNLFSFDNAGTLTAFWTFTGLLAGLGARERALPSRYGALGLPLTPALASLLKGAALVVGLGTALAFVIQTSGAFAFQQAVHRMGDAENMLSQALSVNPPNLTKYDEGCALYDASIRQIEMVIPPLIADPVMNQIRFMAYHGRHGYHRTPQEQQELRRKLYEVGDQALAVYDRDPMILRYYIIDLKDSPDPQDHLRAYEMAQRLVKFEPSSSEVRMLRAQALQTLGNLGLALRDAEKAIALDHTSPSAHALRAQILFALARSVKTDIAARNRYSAEAIASFDEVAKLGSRLLDSDRVGLTIALLYTNQPQRAVIEARKISDPALLKVAGNETAKIYAEMGQPAEGARLAAQMQAGLATPSPGPAPLVGPMPAP
ncbi:MAG: O-antigen ligase family protein [Armatimonadota bacterium]